MTKHDAMKAYFEPKIIELVDDVLHFNFSDEATDNIAFLTNYSDKVIKNYVRAAQKEYGFTILITKEYSTIKLQYHENEIIDTGRSSIPDAD